MHLAVKHLHLNFNARFIGKSGPEITNFWNFRLISYSYQKRPF